MKNLVLVVSKPALGGFGWHRDATHVLQSNIEVDTAQWAWQVRAKLAAFPFTAVIFLGYERWCEFALQTSIEYPELRVAVRGRVDANEPWLVSKLLGLEEKSQLLEDVARVCLARSM